jgi:hypothetical protein
VLRLNTITEVVMPAAFLATALVALSLGQTLESYGGTWIAEFDGAAFVRLELTVTGGALGGRIALGEMQVDAEGRVKAARKAPDRLTPIFDVVVRDEVVSFSHKDGNDTDRFEMRLSGGEAELRFILDEETLKELTDDGIPLPKPVRLKKVPR